MNVRMTYMEKDDDGKMVRKADEKFVAMRAISISSETGYEGKMVKMVSISGVHKKIPLKDIIYMGIKASVRGHWLQGEG